MNFVGRKEEIKAIQKLCSLNQAAIGVIYGRRRIGKSFLLKKATENEVVYFFEGLENRPKQEQIKHFLFQLQSYFGKENDLAEIQTWKSAFILLFRHLLEKPGTHHV